MFRLISMLFVALPLMARAQPAPPERELGEGAPPIAEQRYRVGVELYREGRFAEAAREFRVAQELLPDSPKLTYNVARSLERAGDLSAAYAAYERYLVLSPEAKDRHDVQTVLKALRAELRERQGTLVVSSEPHGAKVYLDGDFAVIRGFTPATLRVRPGRHAVRVVADGLAPADRTADVPERESASVSVQFELEAPTSPTPWLGWGLVGAGAAALAVGAVFHAKASDTADEGERLGPGRPDTARELQDDLDQRSLLMWVGYGAGAALVAGGAALVLWPEAGGPSAVPLQGGVGAGWAGTW